MTYISRTDLNIVQIPTTIPTMGPVGSIVTDPDFKSRIVRATDASTNPSLVKNYSAGIGGSADANIWNTDSTMLSVADDGGFSVLLGFTPATLAIKRIFPNSRVVGGCLFSKINPNVMFNMQGTKIVQYDLSNRTLAALPAPVTVCDFASQLTGKIEWADFGGVENQDTVMSATFSISGGQGTGVYACVWTATKGYRTWNTETGQVTGDWGPLGQVAPCTDKFQIHNAKLNKGTAEYLIVASSAGTSTPNYFWRHDSLTVNNIGHVAPGGHWAGGYGHFYNNDSAPNIPFWSHTQRCLCDLNDATKIATPAPTASLMVGLGDHVSINGPSESLLVSFTSLVLPVGSVIKSFPAAWYNEVIGFDLSGTGKVYRFCHTFCKSNTGNFYADNAIGAVDQQNKFAAFTSDWMGTINRISDVFIVELK